MQVWESCHAPLQSAKHCSSLATSTSSAQAKLWCNLSACERQVEPASANAKPYKSYQKHVILRADVYIGATSIYTCSCSTQCCCSKQLISDRNQSFLAMQLEYDLHHRPQGSPVKLPPLCAESCGWQPLLALTMDWWPAPGHSQCVQDVCKQVTE